MLGERFGMAAGLEAVVEAAAESNGQPDLPPVAEDLAGEVTLFGTYDRAGDAIAAWLTGGADSVHLVLPPGRPEEELAEIVDVAAGVAATDPPAPRGR
jgi:alkanesulfonate monooxygenase SsuD/methylene tetrahydromethanopterin reductase-like flavin-dependent oxidoreductase (luciferase family)